MQVSRRGRRRSKQYPPAPPFSLGNSSCKPSSALCGGLGGLHGQLRFGGPGGIGPDLLRSLISRVLRMQGAQTSGRCSLAARDRSRGTSGARRAGDTAERCSLIARDRSRGTSGARRAGQNAEKCNVVGRDRSRGTSSARRAGENAERCTVIARDRSRGTSCAPRAGENAERCPLIAMDRSGGTPKGGTLCKPTFLNL